MKTLLHRQAELALSRELLAMNMQTAGFEKLVWRLQQKTRLEYMEHKFYAERVEMRF